jgi:predicted Zn-ribbon and HTH transcriptional regulator
MTILVRELDCKRCGHKWYPRRPKAPKVCPECKRDDWQTAPKVTKSVTSSDKDCH